MLGNFISVFYEDRAVFTAAMPLIKERASFLSEIPGKLGYLFAEPPVPAATEFIPKKSDLARTIRLLETGRDITSLLAGLNDTEAVVKERAE